MATHKTVVVPTDTPPTDGQRVAWDASSGGFAFRDQDSGPAGPAGPAGAPAYSTFADDFIQPAVDDTVIVTVDEDPSWMSFGLEVFIESGGYYQVVGLSGLDVTLLNRGHAGINLDPGETVSAAKISPAGIRGTQGEQGIQGIQGDPGVGGGGGWSTLVDVDFTSLSNQDLATGGDGNKTIDGLLFNVSGTANSSIFAVENGNGIHMQCGVSSAGAAMTLLAKFNDIISAYATFSPSEEIEICWQVTSDNLTVNNEGIYIQWGDLEAGKDRLGVGKTFASGIYRYFFRYADPPTGPLTQSNNPSPISGTPDDAFQIYVRSPIQGECYHGVYSSDWPRDWDIEGWRQHATQQSEWIATGNKMYATVTHLAGSSSCLGRNIYIKRFRIRIR